MYKWAIIEESLTDNRFLNDIKILETGVTPDINPEDRWHIHGVLMSRDKIIELSKYIKPAKYYAHFWKWNDMIVVFPNKIFDLNFDDVGSWKPAIKFGLSIDIPIDQLNFSIN
jgi:hypothetical protein